MAYFLKKQAQNNNLYLAIYESFYSAESKGTKQRCHKSLGSITKLIDSGIKDPITYFQNEVDILNKEHKNKKESKKVKKITDTSPLKHLGYFPLSSILNNLDVSEHFDFMQRERNFKYNVFDIFSSLVYARAIAPCSKNKTFHDVLPSLFKEMNYSYDQLLDAIEFIGSEYHKFNEILTAATKNNYGLDTSKTYFDCTNFYFEIEKETDFQRKGPSKENRMDPIVGMGLLLDKNLIPIGMRMYPGNQSEKPIIRDIIHDLKKQNNIDGRTIQVADKGLNCARNIHQAILKNDGYLFSKSVKTLSEKEKAWVLLDKDYKESFDDNKEIKYFAKSCVDTFNYSYTNDEGIKIDFTVKEKRVCTYNPILARKQINEIEKMRRKAESISLSLGKKSEYGESSKYVNFITKSGEKVFSSINEDKVIKDKMLAGYNLLVTSEIIMKDDEIYDTYHSLWAIEQSFRIMKSELDARPVYLQKEDSIKGHFFICYTTVLLARLLQFKELKNKYSITQIFEFIRNFKVTKYSNREYINTAKKSDVLMAIEELTNHPISNYYLSSNQIKMMHTR